jgi:hypothetical protein
MIIIINNNNNYYYYYGISYIAGIIQSYVFVRVLDFASDAQGMF